MFLLVKKIPLGPWSMCHMWIIRKLAIKNRNICFYHIFWLSKLLTGQKIGSKKDITGQDFGTQNLLPDVNSDIKIPYQTKIWLSNNLTGQNFLTGKI